MFPRELLELRRCLVLFHPNQLVPLPFLVEIVQDVRQPRILVDKDAIGVGRNEAWVRRPFVVSVVLNARHFVRSDDGEFGFYP